jgi:hypothetical protein
VCAMRSDNGTPAISGTIKTAESLSAFIIPS